MINYDDWTIKPGAYKLAAKYVTALIRYYPEIKEDDMVDILIREPMLYTDKFSYYPNKIIIPSLSVNDTVYVNPKSKKGWYITTAGIHKLLAADSYSKVSGNKYVKIHYLNTDKYQRNTNRWMLVSNETVEKLHLDADTGMVFAINSGSNPLGFELVKVEACCSRPPMSIKSSDNPLLEKHSFLTEYGISVLLYEHFHRLLKVGKVKNYNDYCEMLAGEDRKADAEDENFGKIKAVAIGGVAVSTENKTVNVDDDYNVFGSRLSDVEEINELNATIADLKAIIADKELALYQLNKKLEDK